MRTHLLQKPQPFHNTMIAGRASRGIVGEITKRARAAPPTVL
jgi:hypothetical protein